ncbi:hypothetical protein EDD41_0075 [Luteococcus japonicus]|uniref:CAAX prenyl protease 2/Lysostaphin resistance protein A-like domain-containing protein n=2 Tax=Luteococcus japonicus TaxID=33984 RepID=A0A3N1ZQ26_9ACTN|nr:type II CAAX endopeptidase family protein [Luteococcus japonicus]ROR52956.1 hypothetical protein EDD41_0075 [Luteococcus japonicus]SJN33589.1 PROBABLE INTEGRAL MEMBRANE PROTEIN [Luteococcus japonicus LSP_Lj1]
MGPDEISRFVHDSLLEPAIESSPARLDGPLRRRVVCLVTVVAGALLLRASLSVAPGDRLFYPATASLALLWLVGARLSGPVVPGHAHSSRGGRASHAVVQSLVWGGLLLVIFLAGALVVSQVPWLSVPVQDLLDHARRGSLPIVALLTALNGLGEEYFFRGALFQALPRHRQVLVSTVLYSVVTAFSGIPLLVLAAAMLGAVVGLQRRATGGFLAPTITHLVWSLGMLFLLPSALSLGAALFG